MTSSDTVERVTREFFNTLHEDDLDGPVWEAMPDEAQHELCRAMRAAYAETLKAIREPEDKILDVGYSAEPLPPMRASREHYRCAWQAMIDQLIADSEAGR